MAFSVVFDILNNITRDYGDDCRFDVRGSGVLVISANGERQYFAPHAWESVVEEVPPCRSGSDGTGTVESKRLPTGIHLVDKPMSAGPRRQW